MPPPRPKIAVVGSLNVDFTFRVPRIPKAGETLSAEGMEVHFGGKGANQAVAAARAGAEVALIGCLGNDEQGGRYRSHLASEGIDTTFLFASDVPTGSAYIALDGRGDNSIIVHPGANARLTIEHLNRCEAVFRSVDTLLLQLECPLPVVAHAAKLAKDAGVQVIVNPSPFASEAITALMGADVWILNQSEFNLLKECSAPNLTSTDREILDLLGCKVLVVTQGAGATVLITKNETISISPPRVEPVDTVGAGDTFAGAFAVAQGELQTLEECVRFANSAGALATIQLGAQASMPQRQLIEELVRQQMQETPQGGVSTDKT